MPTFQYKAIDSRTGQVVKNTVSGITNKQELYNKLKNNGLSPIDIIATFEIIPNKDEKNKKLKNLDGIINLTQNLLILKKAGADDVEALKTITNQEDNIQLKLILKEMMQNVESGEYIYNTMEKYPKVFPATYVNMIKMGELSKSEITSLEESLKYLLKENKRNEKISSAIKPKIIQLIGIIAIFIIGTITIIPCIQNMCNSLDSAIALPWITTAINSLLKVWYYPAIILILVILAIRIYLKKYATGYTSKIFGKLNYTRDFHKVMSSILVSLKNGMNIHEALEESKNVVENKTMLKIINQSIENCSSSDKSWTLPFREVEYGSSMLAEMLKLGEQSELLPRLEKILEITEKDIENTLNKISNTLRKTICVSILLVLIFFVITVLIPSLKIYINAINVLK